jgi:hypothetical protein
MAPDTTVRQAPVVEFQDVETRNGYQPLLGHGSSREKLHALDGQEHFKIEGDGMPEPS